MKTELLFQKNSFLYASLVNVLEMGRDEYGTYFITDKTIFYPQGGGQPNDSGWIETSRLQIRIKGAKYNSCGQVKHYVEGDMPLDFIGAEVAMHVDQHTRKLNSAYHTAGHWLSQIINENLGLPLFPVKGHHFASEAYVAFKGDMESVEEDLIDKLKLAMRIDLQTNPLVTSEIVESDSPKLKNALLPENFKPLINRSLRLVTIDGYKAVPCGGTHYDSLRGIRSIIPTEIYKKGKYVRLKYECTIWNMVPS